jgi:hypothetical protein
MGKCIYCGYDATPFCCRAGIDIATLRARIDDVEGMAKAIEEQQARFPFPTVFSESIARAVSAYLKEG